MTRITHALAFMLAMLVAVTSVQMAQGRGVMASMSAQMIICTGEGTQTVTLDRSGEPMEIVHSCPDCLLTLAITDTPPAYSDPQLIHMHTLAQAAVLTTHSPLIPTHHPARGPPHLV